MTFWLDGSSLILLFYDFLPLLYLLRASKAVALQATTLLLLFVDT